MMNQKTRATAATKTSQTIDDFEEWITSRLVKGHLLNDVILAYIRTFPGRTVVLISQLYKRLNEVHPHGDD